MCFRIRIPPYTAASTYGVYRQHDDGIDPMVGHRGPRYPRRCEERCLEEEKQDDDSSNRGIDKYQGEDWKLG